MHRVAPTVVLSVHFFIPSLSFSLSDLLTWRVWPEQEGECTGGEGRGWRGDGEGGYSYGSAACPPRTIAPTWRPKQRTGVTNGCDHTEYYSLNFFFSQSLCNYNYIINTGNVQKFQLKRKNRQC